MTDKKRNWVGLLVLTQIPSYVAAIALFGLMGMTFLDVIMRSMFSSPFESATELTRLAMAVVVFSSLPMITWRGEHLVVDLLDNYYSDALARFRNVCIDLLAGSILFWPAYRVWQLAERAKEYGDTTEYLQIPQHYIGLFIAFATAVTAVVFLIRALVQLLAPRHIYVNEMHL